MKRRYTIIFFILSFIVEIIFSAVFILKKNDIANDTVKLNEVTTEIKNNFGDVSKYPKELEYSLIDDKGNVLFTNGKDLSLSLNEAYKNGDIIIDIVDSSNNINKLIVKSGIIGQLNKQKNEYVIEMSVIIFIQIMYIMGLYIYMHKTMIKPFDEMKEFAERVATGDLDIPLNMDRHQNFGAFTESFDIMRSELKKAKIAEMEAEKSKKELVARLSHDIKTPISSIKSVSELGEAITNEDKVKTKFNLINQKADQINTLITNLFNVTIEELDELKVSPTEIPSYVVKEIIEKADYLNRGNDIMIPKCNLYFDRLRLQQVFDNIFMNSYKYADTKIEVSAEIKEEFLVISVKDFGDTIKDEEIPLLFEKYNRGSNVSNKEGAGLGLFISKKFMEAQNGNIEIINDKPGFKVLVYLRII